MASEKRTYRAHPERQGRWKVELLTSHVPTSTTLVHYTQTRDLRETCAAEVQLIADWIELEAIIETRRSAAPVLN